MRVPLLLTAALLVCSLLTVSHPAGAAISDFAGLNTALSKAAAGQTLTINGNAAGTITFSNSSPALAINRANLTLKGAGLSARVASQIGDSVESLLAGLKPDTLDDLASKARDLGSSWLADADGSLAGMTAIKGPSSGVRNPTTGKDANQNEKKWLRVADTATSSYTGLSLENLSFTGANAEYSITSKKSGIVNGLIGNVNLAGVDASLGNITGSAFTNLSVTVKGLYDTDYLAGGGIIGVRSTGETTLKNASASAGIGTISGNLFKGVRVTTTDYNGGAWDKTTQSAYIEGGGLIGVDGASSPSKDTSGVAEIKELSNNIFTEIEIRTDDILLGGGLVGVNNNSQRPLPLNYTDNDVDGTYSVLGIAKGNVFSAVSVDAGYSIRGGGVIGVNGLSTAGARLTFLSGNIFSDIHVASRLSYIKGGGIVGLQANYLDNENEDKNKFKEDAFGLAGGGRPVILTSAAGNFFLGSDVTAETYLYGGGIVGLYSSESLAALGELKGNLFKGLTVRTNGNDASGYGLKGGGIVGVSTMRSGLQGDVKYNYFDDIEVEIAKKLAGGGVLGVQSDSEGDLAFGSNIVDNSFTKIKVKAEAIEGGGIVGTQGKSGSSTTSYTTVGFGGNPEGEFGYENGLSGNRLSDIDVQANGYISGGGVFGVYSELGGAIMRDVNNNVTDRVKVTAGSYIEGGGLIGIRSNFIGQLNNLENNYFYGSTVTAGTYIDGGGIVGLTSGNPGWKVNKDMPLILGIDNIEDNVFTGSEITANNGTISGGLIYSYGTAADGMTIKNSYFYNNTFTSKITDSLKYEGAAAISPKVYGTVTVDTGHGGTGSPFTLTLDARPEGDAGERIIAFSNNTIVEGEATRKNSLYFGTVDGMKTDPVTGEIAVVHDEADSDAKLVVKTEKGGTVLLADPIAVSQDNGKAFNMEVASPVEGKQTGYFAWGGENEFIVDKNASSQKNRIDLKPGSYTQLLKGMELYAPNHLFRLWGGENESLNGKLSVSGSNVLTLGGAKLNGSILFDLNGTTVNDASTALLKIHGTTVDIGGSTIYLSPINNGSVLREGDRYYLIATDKPGYIKGKQTNDFAASSAYARGGYTLGYNFTIDTVVPTDLSDTNPTATASAWDEEEETSQYLVARLPMSRLPKVDPNPPYVEIGSAVTDDPPHVEIGSKVGEPLYVEFKEMVTGDPPHVEIGSKVGEPLYVEYKSAVGEPLHVEVGSSVGEPLYVEFKSAVGEPLHVEFGSSVGDPLYVEVKSAVGEPLVVEFKSAVTDDPPVVYYGSKVGEPLYVETKDAKGDPLYVEVKSAVGEPLVVEVKSAVGEPLVVEFKEAVTGEPPVIRLPETGTPLYVIQYAEVDDNPPVVYIGSKVDDNPPVVIIDDPDDPEPVIPIPIEKSAVGEPLVVYVRTEVGDPPYVLLVPTDTPEEETTPSTPLPDTPPTVSGDQPVAPIKPSDTPGKTDDPSPFSPPAPPVVPDAAPETTAITNGRLAALAFAGARGTWLADHSYESANIILSKDLREDDWTRVEAPFAGIDGAWLRAENEHSHIKIDSVNVIAGYAVKTRHEGRDGKSDSSTLLGAFLDFGHGSYTTYDHFDHVVGGVIPDIHGDGTLRAYGFGVMARKEWENDFRLEGSLRAGKLENEFSAGDYLDSNGVPMSYETDTPYYGAHLGAGKTFKLSNPRNEVDLRLRYYWDKQDGETVSLPNGEIVEFMDDDSHRLRFGARFTHEDEELRRWYIGAAVEHEFSGKVHARTINFDLPGYNLIDLRSESLEGTTGIAELGVDIRPYKYRNFSIVTGIQGYFGKYRGISGGIRLEWEF
ncbi:MAG: hypothetical protein LBR71_07600 [Synergistaceae bacterium]|nr:hypothetical protein [Synergistaceae bacterium]